MKPIPGTKIVAFFGPATVRDNNNASTVHEPVLGQKNSQSDKDIQVCKVSVRAYEKGSGKRSLSVYFITE